jgi:hypothetical protein
VTTNPNKRPLQFPGEGDKSGRSVGSLWFDDALESVGFRRAEAVETFEGDEHLVGAGVGEAQVAEGHAGDRVGDRAGLLVVGDGLEVAHGHCDRAGVGSEADELLCVVRRDEGGLVQIESGDALDHALGDGGGVEVEVEALGHHIVGEHFGVVARIEHERTRVWRYLGIATGFAKVEYLLVIEGGWGAGGGANVG